MASKYTIRGVADMTQHDEQLKKSAAEVYKYEKNVKSASGQLNQFSNAAKNVANGVGTLNDGFAIMNNSTAPLKLKLREITNVLADLEMQGKANTKEFTQLAQYAGTLENALGDARTAIRTYSDDTLSIEAATQAMGAFANVGSVATGVMGLLGVENENVSKTLVRVQSAMAVANGLTQLSNNLNKDSALMLKLKAMWTDVATAGTVKNSTALGVNTVATNVNTFATKAWNVAKAISKALFGDLTGLILVGAAVLTTYSLATNSAKDSEEEQNKALEEAKKKIDEQREAYVSATAQYNSTASRIDHLRTAYINTNSELEKTAILKEATAEFKKLGISVNGAADAQDILINKGQYVIELLRLQGNAAALASVRMEAYKKSFSMLLENGYDTTAASILAGNSSDVQRLDKELDRLNSKASELKGKLNIGTKSKSSSTTSKKGNTTTTQKDNSIDIDKFLNRKEKYGEIKIEPKVTFGFEAKKLDEKFQKGLDTNLIKNLEEQLQLTQKEIDERKLKINIDPEIVNNFGEVANELGGAFSSIGKYFKIPKFDILDTIGQSIANVALGYSKATTQAAELGPWAWIAFAATGFAQMVSMIAAIKNTTSGFANGGIVGGQTTIGDYNLARVNKGEMILNTREQSRLFGILNGNGGYGESVSDSNVHFRISGNDLVGVLNNYNKKRSKVL